MAIRKVFAEFRVTDKVSKTLGKLDKRTTKSVKALGKLDKTTDKVGKRFKRSSKEAERFAKSLGKVNREQKKGGRFGAGARRLGGRVRAGVSGVGGGGGLRGVAAAAGVIGIPLAALASVVAQFRSAIPVFKELKESQGRLAIVFGSGVNALVASFQEGFFREKEQQNVASFLGGQGVSGDFLKKELGKLEAFVQAQGFTDLAEGVNAIISGNIKLTEGISKSQVERLRALGKSGLFGNVFTFEEGIRRMLGVIAESGGAVNKTAKAFVKITKGAKGAENLIKKQDELSADVFASQAVNFAKFSKVQLKIQSELLIPLADLGKEMASLLLGAVKIAKVLGSVVSGTVKAIKGAVTARIEEVKRGAKAIFEFVFPSKKESLKKELPKLPGAQLGGSIERFVPTLVGERGPEIIASRRDAMVLKNRDTANVLNNNNQKTQPLKNGTQINAPVTFTANITINSTGDITLDIVDSVDEAMKILAQTKFRFDAGLTLAG